jgi:hypothetical protein
MILALTGCGEIANRYEIDRTSRMVFCNQQFITLGRDLTAIMSNPCIKMTGGGWLMRFWLQVWHEVADKVGYYVQPELPARARLVVDLEMTTDLIINGMASSSGRTTHQLHQTSCIPLST